MFRISTQKNILVKDIGRRVDNVWVWDLSWRRALSDRERALVAELCNVLSVCNLKVSQADCWKWWPDSSGVYSVSTAYRIQVDAPINDEGEIVNQVWSLLSPSNVAAFGWRLLIDRVQTRGNLRKRRIIQNMEDAFCPFCGSVEETADHLFYTCSFSYSVWMSCFKWMGIYTVFPKSGLEHFSQHFSHLLSKEQNRGFKTIWISIVWSLWLHRNGIIFHGIQADVGVVLEQIQARSWCWLSAKVNGFSHSMFEWVTNVLLCLKTL